MYIKPYRLHRRISHEPTPYQVFLQGDIYYASCMQLAASPPRYLYVYTDVNLDFGPEQ